MIASEDLETPTSPLAVAVGPLYGSSNIDGNVSIGTIFSVLRMPERSIERQAAKGRSFVKETEAFALPP